MSQELSTQPTDPSELDLARTATIAKVVNNLAAGMTISRACKVAGITDRTWRRWKEQGLVQEMLADKFTDVMAGVRETVANGLVQSTVVLVSIANGRIPTGTDFDGKLAPRDAVAAQQQLMRLWTVVADPEGEKERQAQDTIDKLRDSAVNIMTVHVNTINVGTEQEPLPVPSGVMLDVVPTLVEEGEYVVYPEKE